MDLRIIARQSLANGDTKEQYLERVAVIATVAWDYPGARITIPDPDKESAFNGTPPTAEEVSAFMRTVAPGVTPKISDIVAGTVNAAGKHGNRKSYRDRSGITNLIKSNQVPEVTWEEGTRSRLVRRLTDQTSR
jgi:hypothetical protein